MGKMVSANFILKNIGLEIISQTHFSCVRYFSSAGCSELVVGKFIFKNILIVVIISKLVTTCNQY